MYRHILVPLDGSTNAEKAIPHAVQLANRFNSRVTLVRVTHVQSRYFIQFGAKQDIDAMKGTYESALEEAHAYLNRVKADLLAQGIEAESYLASSQLVAEHIVFAGEEVGADGIVMATHGRYGFDRLINGSVAEDVIKLAGIPVIWCRQARHILSPSGTKWYQAEAIRLPLFLCLPSAALVDYQPAE